MEENPIPVADLKRKFLSGKKPWLVILLFLLILAFLPGYYFYNQYQKTQKLLQNSNQTQSAELDKLVSQVGKLIELPKNERPTVATVSDKTKLSNQPFFANAQNGDKVLIYAQAEKAILYRPSINKIIEVAPVNIGENQPTPSVGISPVSSVTVTPIPTATKTPASINPPLSQ